MSKLNAIPNQQKKWQSNPNSILEGPKVDTSNTNRNTAINEKYESPASQPEADYEVNYSDGNTGATKETFKVSKQQL